jgi:hypothetical protein
MFSLLPARPARAAAHGLILWLTGMIVGSVAFAVPGLKAKPAIPYVSANPAISLPILVLWPVVAFLLVRGPLARAPIPAREGLRIGCVFLAVNAALDLGLVVGAMKAGLEFYSYASLWVAYGVLVAVPWLTGRSLARLVERRSRVPVTHERSLS